MRAAREVLKARENRAVLKVIEDRAVLKAREDRAVRGISLTDAVARVRGSALESRPRMDDVRVEAHEAGGPPARQGWERARKARTARTAVRKAPAGTAAFYLCSL